MAYTIRQQSEVQDCSEATHHHLAACLRWRLRSIYSDPDGPLVVVSWNGTKHDLPSESTL